VVVFTQSRDEQDAVQSYKLGACSFVTKPMQAERFEELVRGFAIYWDTIRLVRD
jgi:two-component system response regulator